MSGAREITTLTLPWEDRTKSRLKVELDNGESAGLFLNRGEVLRNGDLLSSEDGYRVRVIAANEELSCAVAASQRQLNIACYHLGNRHVSLEIGDGEVRYLKDHVLDDMVRSLGLEVGYGMHPFEPESGAYGGHHHHGH